MSRVSSSANPRGWLPRSVLWVLAWQVRGLAGPVRWVMRGCAECAGRRVSPRLHGYETVNRRLRFVGGGGFILSGRVVTHSFPLGSVASPITDIIGCLSASENLTRLDVIRNRKPPHPVRPGSVSQGDSEKRAGWRRRGDRKTTQQRRDPATSRTCDLLDLPNGIWRPTDDLEALPIKGDLTSCQPHR